MADKPNRKRRASGSTGTDNKEQSNIAEPKDAQGTAPYPPYNTEDFVRKGIEFLRNQERERELEGEEEDDDSDEDHEASDARGNSTSSQGLVASATNQIDPFADDGDDWDRLEAELGVTDTIEKTPDKRSSKPATQNKSKKRPRAPADKVPTSDSNDNDKGKRKKSKAAKRQERQALEDVGRTQEEIVAAEKFRAQQKEETKKLRALQKAEFEEKGYTEGTPDALPSTETYQYDSDDVIAEDDPYFKSGCERRMVFTSDTVPNQDQYVNGGRNTDTDYPNAVDKFFTWCQTRPTSAKKGQADWDEAEYNDGRKARHFVLKMGPPHGAYGRPSRLAARLKSAWDQLLRKRLQSSHVTIKTEIPTTLAGTDYYKAYMDQILALTGPKQLGKRLTVKLAAGPTAALEHINPTAFYEPPINIEAAWREKQGHTFSFHSYVLSLVMPNWRSGWPLGDPMPVPSFEQIEKAKYIFTEQKEAQMRTREENVDAAVANVKIFINEIRKFERSKELARGVSAQEPLVVEDLTTAVTSTNVLAPIVPDTSQKLPYQAPLIQNDAQGGSSLQATGTNQQHAEVTQPATNTGGNPLANDGPGSQYHEWYPDHHYSSKHPYGAYVENVEAQDSTLNPARYTLSMLEPDFPQHGYQKPDHGIADDQDFYDLSGPMFVPKHPSQAAGYAPQNFDEQEPQSGLHLDEHEYQHQYQTLEPSAMPHALGPHETTAALEDISSPTQAQTTLPSVTAGPSYSPTFPTSPKRKRDTEEDTPHKRQKSLEKE